MSTLAERVLACVGPPRYRAPIPELAEITAYVEGLGRALRGRTLEGIRLRSPSLLRTEEATLKRALTDPRVLSGIGNAHSDEILLFARLSPLQLTRNLDAVDRPAMAAHGKHGKPCPVCGAPIQRIRYADRETNYCPVCQTEGKVLADRGLSRLLGDDWPRTLEEMEELKGR